jgi:hypothetical protein
MRKPQHESLGHAPDRHVVLRLPDELAHRMRERVKAGRNPQTSFGAKSRSASVATTVRLENVAATHDKDAVESLVREALGAVRVRRGDRGQDDLVAATVASVDVRAHNRDGVFTVSAVVASEAKGQWLRLALHCFVVEDEAPEWEPGRRGGFSTAMYSRAGARVAIVDAPYVVPQEFFFTFENEEYPATLVDLPCVTEVYKTADRTALYKSGDVGQILIVRMPPPPAGGSGGGGAAAGKEEGSGGGGAKPRHYVHPHGLTPPTQHIVRRRFRRTTTRQAIDAPATNPEVRANQPGANAQVSFTPPPEGHNPLHEPILTRREHVSSNHSHMPSVHNTELDLVQLASFGKDELLTDRDVVFTRRGLVRESDAKPLKDYVHDDRSGSSSSAMVSESVSGTASTSISASHSALPSRSGSPLNLSQSQDRSAAPSPFAEFDDLLH